MAGKNVLVFQHLVVEHPGVFRDFLAEEGHRMTVVELDEGESIPALEHFDALWVMGGPMDVWEEQEHPWLIAEKRAIREAVRERQLPYLGFCLGHQLLAEALGGTVGKAALPEVGIMEVQLAPAAGTATYLDGLPPRFEVLQWHGAEVQRLPEGAALLASSARCPVQAMAWGRGAFSMQFHIEVTSSAVDEWSSVPAYLASLEQTLGAAGTAEFGAKTLACMPEFNTRARRIYTNWKSRSGFG